jgi:hypothetical protein
VYHDAELGPADEQHGVVGRVAAVDIAPEAGVDKVAAAGYRAALEVVAPGSAYFDDTMEPPVGKDIAVVHQVADTEPEVQWTQGKHAIAGLAGIGSEAIAEDRLSVAIALAYASIESWEEVRASGVPDHNLGAEMRFLGDWVPHS